MADFTRYIDGLLTLELATAACEIEQDKGSQLQTISATTTAEGNQVLLVNEAGFVGHPTSAKRKLLFVEVGSQHPESVKQQKLSQGWTFISHSHIYVEGVLAEVMVFAK